MVKSLLSKVFEWFEVQEEAHATQLLLLLKISNTSSKKVQGILQQQKYQNFLRVVNCNFVYFILIFVTLIHLNRVQ